MLPLGTLVMLLIIAPEQDLYYNLHKAARTWLVSINNTGLMKKWRMDELNLGPTQSILLQADIIVSKDCDLNTIISATIELEGGSDDLGRPILELYQWH